MGFLESVRPGVLFMYLVGEKLTIFNGRKKLPAPWAPDLIITDERFGQLSPFPSPPPPPLPSGKPATPLLEGTWVDP